MNSKSGQAAQERLILAANAEHETKHREANTDFLYTVMHAEAKRDEAILAAQREFDLLYDQALATYQARTRQIAIESKLLREASKHT